MGKNVRSCRLKDLAVVALVLSVVAYGCSSGPKKGRVTKNESADAVAETDVFASTFFGDYPDIYDEQIVIADRSGLSFIADNDKIGLADKSGKTILEPVYECVELTGDGKNVLVIKDGFFGFYTVDGKEIFPAEYESIASLSFVSVNSDYGEYGDFAAGIDTDPYLFMQKDGKVGAADKKGRFIRDMIYENISLCGDRLFCMDESGVDIADVKSRKVVHVDCEQCEPSVDAYCSIMVDGKWGIVDADGKLVADIVYDDIPNQSEGLVYCLTENGNEEIAVIKDGRYGIIDLSGNVLLPFEYDYIDTCRLLGGFRMLFIGDFDADEWQYDGKWGLYKDGEVIRQCVYPTRSEVDDIIMELLN